MAAHEQRLSELLSAARTGTQGLVDPGAAGPCREWGPVPTPSEFCSPKAGPYYTARQVRTRLTVVQPAWQGSPHPTRPALESAVFGKLFGTESQLPAEQRLGAGGVQGAGGCLLPGVRPGKGPL